MTWQSVFQSLAGIGVHWIKSDPANASLGRCRCISGLFGFQAAPYYPPVFGTIVYVAHTQKRWACDWITALKVELTIDWCTLLVRVINVVRSVPIAWPMRVRYRIISKYQLAAYQPPVIGTNQRYPYLCVACRCESGELPSYNNRIACRNCVCVQSWRALN